MMDITVEADTDDSSKSTALSDYLLSRSEQETCSLVYGFSEDNVNTSADVEINFSDSGSHSSPQTEYVSLDSPNGEGSSVAGNSEYIVIYNAENGGLTEIPISSPPVDIIVPDEVAAEAIVRTSSPTDTDTNMYLLSKQKKSRGRKLVKPSEVETQGEASPWPSLDLSHATNSGNISDGDMNTLITVYSDGSTCSCRLSQENSDNDIKDINRRELAKIRKRKQRSDIGYRTTEKERTRERMKSKRLDPEYRQKEREKDRIRRKLARQNDKALRQRERERDREYHRRQKVLNNSSEGQQLMYELQPGMSKLYAVDNDSAILEDRKRTIVTLRQSHKPR